MCSNEVKKEVLVEERYCYEEEKELTVHKASMFNQGDGFIVYDSKGDIVFRVDSYAPTKNRLLLMDSIGKPLLTLLPKRPTLHHRWAAFLGEMPDERQPQPIFSIWKSTVIGQSNVMVEVHGKSPIMYQIEGSYCERSCTLFHVPCLDDDRSKVSMAQINRKIEPTRKMVLGRDVFTLIIKPGCDAAFVMGLVLALDRIVGDDAAHMECHNSQLTGTF